MKISRIQEYRRKPPSTYIDNQFNVCPSSILRHLDKYHSNWETVLDFGCGHGIKALSIALQYPDRSVIGVDITNAYQQAECFAIEELHLPSLPKNLNFYKIEPGQSLSSIAKDIDAIYSWSVFEHVNREMLPSIIEDMFISLSKNGIVFSQIAPLFFSPFGSHLKEFLTTPWAHLLLSHSDLKKLIEVNDDNLKKRKWMFSRYEELNKLTSEELLDYFIAAGFSIRKNRKKHVSFSPPKELLRIYGIDLLITNEIFYVAEKKQNKLRFSLIRGR